MKKENFFHYSEKFWSIVDKELNCKYELVENEYIEMIGEIIEVIKSLPTQERLLLILYSELGSLRKVAKIYNCSEGTIRHVLKSIKQKFEHLYENRYELMDNVIDDDNYYCVHYRLIWDND